MLGRRLRPWAAAAALLLPAAGLAWRPAVEVPGTGFSARAVDGRVLCAWNRYVREDFSAYLLVKSSGPAVLQAPVLFASDDRGGLGYVDGELSTGTWRYRLFILTRFGDAWASPEVEVRLSPADLLRRPPKADAFEW